MARRVVVRQKKIDFKSWAGIPSLQTDISTDTTTLGPSLVFTGPATVLRIRGYVSGHFDSTVMVDDDIVLTFAMGVISTDAFSAGAGSVPDPAGEPEYPWVWYHQMTLFAESTMGLGTHAWGLGAQRAEIDSKAMRKMKPGQNLAFICQSAGASGAPTTTLNFGLTRVLVGT